MAQDPKCSGGFTLIELLIVVAIISLVSAIAVPLYEEALEKTHRSAIQADCYSLYNSMMSYHFDYDKFPAEAQFNVATLAPVSTEGYFNATSTFTDKLDGEKLLIYIAPDVDGPDSQFIIVARSELDPTAIFAVVHTNIVTDDGDWVDGVYVITPDDLADAGDDLADAS